MSARKATSRKSSKASPKRSTAGSKASPKRSTGGSQAAAKRSTGGSKGSQSTERLLEQTEAPVANAGGPSSTDKVTRHLRRFGPFYALGLVIALVILLIPSKNTSTQPTSAAGQVANGDSSVNANQSGTSAAAGKTASGGSGRSVAANTSGFTDLNSAAVKKVEAEVQPSAWKLSGKTAGGFDCKPGVRQLPWSSYANPCYPKWSGYNGGATTRGVTADKIVIVSRHFADSANQQAQDKIVGQAGFATGDTVSAADKVFRAYFERVFELWGRKVDYQDYVSKNGVSTTEQFGGGKDVACQDADDIIAKYHPYAVVGTGKQPGATGVFGECAAARHLVVLGTGPYYPEWWYQRYHPYLWNGTMNCTMIGYQNAEYIGKRLAHHNAKWAKGVEKGKPRTFALFVPTNAEYQSCVGLASAELNKKYHQKFTDQFNYVLDISRLGDQATLAIAKFHSHDDTTIFLACDPLAPIFLTQDATNQGYFPEWVTNGAGLTDVEQFARLWDQVQIQNSLFGMSQVDTGRVLGPNGEGVITYRKAIGQQIPAGTQTQYYAELELFGALQATGPIITPQRMAEGIWQLPPGGVPSGEVGYANTQLYPDGTPGRQHTSVSDMREIYWKCDSFATDPGGTSRCKSPTAYDGHGGVYLSTYGGKRFRNGQWPTGEPPIYP